MVCTCFGVALILSSNASPLVNLTQHDMENRPTLWGLDEFHNFSTHNSKQSIRSLNRLDVSLSIYPNERQIINCSFLLLDTRVIMLIEEEREGQMCFYHSNLHRYILFHCFHLLMFFTRTSKEFIGRVKEVQPLCKFNEKLSTNLTYSDLSYNSLPQRYQTLGTIYSYRVSTTLRQAGSGRRHP